ncbi:MAG: hypothetical protein HOY78_29065 [Saccharothrix sp.]|nr:hypothetical protein [Saccharothrix sp.]
MAPRWLTRRRAVVASAAAAVVACGAVAAAVVATNPTPSAHPAPLTSTSTSTTTPDPTTTTTTGTTRIETIVPTTRPPTTTTTTTKPPADDGFAWLPWGPADPGDPPPIQWYAGFQEGRCAEVFDDEATLWKAVSALCEAVIEGDEDQWRKVRVAEGSGLAPCLEAAARALLERAIAWHERNPGRNPAITFAREGQTPACPLKVTAVVGENTTCVTTPGRLSGPVSGGTNLTICGSGFAKGKVNVLLGDREATVRSVTPGSVEVTTPEAAGPGAVRIEVVSAGVRVVAAQRFEYVAEVVPTS